jgi:hypothetical protein
MSERVLEFGEALDEVLTRARAVQVAAAVEVRSVDAGWICGAGGGPRRAAGGGFCAGWRALVGEGFR